MTGIHTLQALALVVGVVLPALVGLVTKQSWSGGTKAVLLAALSAVTGFGSQALDAANAGNAYDWRTGLLTALGAFVVAVSTHYGLLKPTGVTRVIQGTVVKDKPLR